METFSGGTVSFNGTWISPCRASTDNDIETLVVNDEAATDTDVTYTGANCTGSSSTTSGNDTLATEGTISGIAWTGTPPADSPASLTVTKLQFMSGGQTAFNIVVVDTPSSPFKAYSGFGGALTGSYPTSLDATTEVVQQ